jgi:hypothetical protein
LDKLLKEGKDRNPNSCMECLKPRGKFSSHIPIHANPHFGCKSESFFLIPMDLPAESRLSMIFLERPLEDPDQEGDPKQVKELTFN